MVDNVATGVLTASTRAGVGTFVPDAGFVSRAVVVENALRSATGVRVALVFRQTGADTFARALSVGPTR